LIRFAGWWGNDPQTRFTMPHDFIPVKSADAWQLSNAPVLPMAALRASLEIFAEAGVQNLIKKRKLMNDFLRFIIGDIISKTNSEKNIIMITPENESERAAQVSMLCKHNGKKIHGYLTEQGIIADWREKASLPTGANLKCYALLQFLFTIRLMTFINLANACMKLCF